jgi:hypothetical protein
LFNTFGIASQTGRRRLDDVHIFPAGVQFLGPDSGRQWVPLLKASDKFWGDIYNFLLLGQQKFHFTSWWHIRANILSDDRIFGTFQFRTLRNDFSILVI